MSDFLKLAAAVVAVYALSIAAVAGLAVAVGYVVRLMDHAC